MPLTLPNARQYQGARGTRAQGSVSSREVVVLKSTSSTEAEPAAPPPAAACTLIPNKGTIRHSLFYSLGGLLGDLTQPAQPGRPSAGACHCLSNRIPLSAGWLLQAIFR
jgi:hypothetical protein